MALATQTWDELVALVQAMVGNDGVDYAQMRVLANLAAQRAYRSHFGWERYIVAGEPRTISRGYIAFSEDSYSVYGAGTDEVNDLYQRNGTANGNPRYSLYKSDGTSVLWDIEYDGSGAWDILVGADHETLTENTVYYTVTSTDATPPLSGWVTEDAAAVAPAPLLVDVANIDTFLDVYIDGYPPDGTGGWRADRRVDSSGCYVEVGGSEATKAYVVYKKAHTDQYGDGTEGTVTDIPEEWFYYMALYTARQLQISYRRSNSSPYAVIASREVEDSLADEHIKICQQGIIDTVGRQVQTGISQSTMLN